MKINRNNYESFFLDFHEGNLDKNSVNELMGFLALNPDLKQEFEEFQNIPLNVDHGVSFGNKEKLKRNTITINNYKTWFVAFLENDLDVTQRIEVEEFIERNPAYKAELHLLNQTILQPENDIRFKNKSSLKKGGIVIPMWVRTAAAAAVVIGILSYWFVGNENAKQVKLPQTDKQEVKTTDSQVKITPAPPEQKSTNTALALSPSNKTHRKNNPHSAPTEEPMQNKTAVQTTNGVVEKSPENISTPRVHPVIAEEEPNIVINATGKNAGKPTTADSNAFVALDDNDLVELGLKQTDSSASSGFVQSAVKSAGNLFGINVKHSAENNAVMSTYKETFALGKIEISRTVLR